MKVFTDNATKEYRKLILIVILTKHITCITDHQTYSKIELTKCDFHIPFRDIICLKFHQEKTTTKHIFSNPHSYPNRRIENDEPFI